MFEEHKEKLGLKFAQELESDRSRTQFIRFFFAGFAGNVVCWLIVLFLPHSIAEAIGKVVGFSDALTKCLLMIPLACTFISVFALCRMRKSSHPVSQIADDEFGSGFRDHIERERLRNTILFAGMIGAVNTIALVVVLIWYRELF